jgi:hypothetical protein
MQSQVHFSASHSNSILHFDDPLSAHHFTFHLNTYPISEKDPFDLDPLTRRVLRFADNPCQRDPGVSVTGRAQVPILDLDRSIQHVHAAGVFKVDRRGRCRARREVRDIDTIGRLSRDIHR